MVDRFLKVVIEGRSAGDEATVNTMSQSATRWRLPYSQISNGNFAASIVSSSANDAALGSGARTVEIRGLNTNGLPYRQTFSLNGTTPVPLGNWGFISDVYVDSSGSTPLGVNVGELSVTSGGFTINSVAAGAGRSYTGVYKVPSNAHFIIERVMLCSESSAEDATCLTRFYSFDASTQPFAMEEKRFIPRLQVVDVPLPLGFGPGTILEIAQSRTGATSRARWAQVIGSLNKY